MPEVGTTRVRPAWWEDACTALSAADEVMRGVIAAHPTGMMVSRGDAFSTLARAVVGQQISVKAADAVWGRFHTLAEARGGMVPQVVAGLQDDALRACGLSGGKARYVAGIARGFAKGTVHPGLWDGMADEAIVAELVKLPGIGRWTAEMFLMFHLARPDVLPVDDLGLVKGFKKAYGARWKTDGNVKVWQGRLRRVAEVWRPHRSVAVWYLWRSLDPLEVSY